MLLAVLFALIVGVSQSANGAEQTPSKPTGPKEPQRIGIIHLGQQPDAPVVTGVRQGLRELNYVEGRDVILHIRAGRGQYSSALDSAHELVKDVGVHILVSAGTLATRAAREAAGEKVPVIFTQVGDPVAEGFVASFPKPGRNLTGFSHLLVDTTGKRLELLKEILPSLRTALVIFDPSNKTSSNSVEAAREPARKLGVRLREHHVKNRDDALQAIEQIDRKTVDALLVVPDSLVVNHGDRIIAKSREQLLPVMFHESTWVNRGGLASYGASFSDLGRQAARHIDKVIRGESPDRIPVEYPTRFELIINLRTAKTLGLVIPPSVLIRVDRVIE